MIVIREKALRTEVKDEVAVLLKKRVSRLTFALCEIYAERKGLIAVPAESAGCSYPRGKRQ